jgi:hypothetical protein
MTGRRSRAVETAPASVHLDGAALRASPGFTPAGAVSTISGSMRQTITIQVGQL